MSEFANKVNGDKKEYPDFGRVFQTYSSRASSIKFSQMDQDSEFYFKEIETFVNLLESILNALNEATNEAGLTDVEFIDNLFALLKKLRKFLKDKPLIPMLESEKKKRNKLQKMIDEVDETFIEAYAEIESRLMHQLHAKQLVAKTR